MTSTRTRSVALIVAVVVVTAIALGALGAATFHHAVTAAGDPISRADLQRAAAAEAAFLGTHGTYTASLTDLATVGFTPTIGTFMSIESDGAIGYCLVAEHLSPESKADFHEFLYDSQRGGLSPVEYQGTYEAEAACSLGASDFVDGV